MRTAGEILIEGRKLKSLTLEQVEKETRIRKNILEKLEKGDWASLEPTYTKGLLKNYANYLGLDEKRVLAFYRREYDEKKQAKSTGQLKKIQPRFRLTPTLLSILLIIGVVSAVVFYLFYQYRSFTAAPYLNVQEPEDNIKISSLQINVVGSTLNDSILKINGEDVQVSPGGTFSVAVGLKKGVNLLTITSANRFGNISTVNRTVVVEGSEEAKNDSENEVVNLELKIIDRSTFLTIEVDGKKTFEGLMLEGSSKAFSAKDNIKISSDDGGATFIKFKGDEFSLGKRGEKIEREFGVDD